METDVWLKTAQTCEGKKRESLCLSVLFLLYVMLGMLIITE